MAVPGLLALAAIALDRATKLAADGYLEFRGPVSVFGDYVRLVLWHNEGAAFGLHLGGQWVHIGLSLFAMVLVGYLIVHTPRTDRVSLSGFSLIVGGAVGNLWDRFHVGRVTDFIDLGVGMYRWPTFNLADAAVVVGIGLLIIAHLRNTRAARLAEAGEQSGEALAARRTGGGQR